MKRFGGKGKQINNATHSRLPSSFPIASRDRAMQRILFSWSYFLPSQSSVPRAPETRAAISSHPLPSLLDSRRIFPRDRERCFPKLERTYMNALRSVSQICSIAEKYPPSETGRTASRWRGGSAYCNWYFCWKFKSRLVGWFVCRGSLTLLTALFCRVVPNFRRKFPEIISFGHSHYLFPLRKPEKLWAFEL